MNKNIKLPFGIKIYVGEFDLGSYRDVDGNCSGYKGRGLAMTKDCAQKFKLIWDTYIK